MNKFSDVRRKLGVQVYNKLRKELVVWGGFAVTKEILYKLFPYTTQFKIIYAFEWIKHTLAVRYSRHIPTLQPTIQERLAKYKRKKVCRYLESQGILGELSGKYSRIITFYKSSPEEINIPFIKAYTNLGDRYSSKCSYRKTDIQWVVHLPVDWEQRIKDMPPIKKDSDGNRVVIFDKRPSPFNNIWYVSWITKGRGVAEVRTYHGVCIPYKRTYRLFTNFEGTLFDETLARLGIRQL